MTILRRDAPNARIESTNFGSGPEPEPDSGTSLILRENYVVKRYGMRYEGEINTAQQVEINIPRGAAQ